MAYDRHVGHNNLEKVALDGFSIIEKHYGRGSLQKQTPPPPPPPSPVAPPAARRRPQDKYHYQKLAPNQYYYEEPDDDQAYVTAKEPAFRNYRPLPPAKQCYET
ncbi:hypothetical protein PTKIN_Ptkin09bG0016900 [Pterospermum kingtungense]